MIHFWNKKLNREKSNKLPKYFDIQQRCKAQMKPKKVLGIQKKIKKKICIIFIDEEYLGSPKNTNQFLLQKHQSLEVNIEKKVQPPESMLSYLLNEEKNDHPLTNSNNFKPPEETSELSQLLNNYYQI
ncbi:unnamed protein product [Paramecium sonneborni]|uniref:Uncharacterized protein n=1 Tax=Paramecium sonneborni TaxID=65129 RepID=A0A8S1KUX7_9CILI|nr:unnamed protein product [Paramecium sonneborni]